MADSRTATCLRLPPLVHSRLEFARAETGKYRNDMITEAIVEFLDKYKLGLQAKGIQAKADLESLASGSPPSKPKKKRAKAGGS